MRTLKAGALYFVLVFSAGFVLGVIRELLVVPRAGAMWAELAEAPLMLGAIVAAARWTVKRAGRSAGPAGSAGVGLTALALMAAAEAGLAGALRGMTLSEYVAGREPVSSAVYLALLAVFAAMPALLSRRPARRLKRGLTPI